jgi:hypothetical protein
MRELADIQRAFYELVTAGEGAIPPGLLAGPRRLDVYAEAYLARLSDILVADYPKLWASLGDDAFRALAASYLRARPPTSFTVRDAGLALPGYLATRDDLPALADDLAALERARIEVFDGPDRAPLARNDLASVPAEQFPELALALIPASQLVTIVWTVDELWSAIEDGAPMPPAEAAPVTRGVLVWRRDLRVLHRTLDDDEAALAPLLAAGTTIAELAARLAELVAQPEVRLVELLGRWLDAGVLVGA